MTFHLGLDLDGVVADYTAGFGAFVAAQAGISVTELPPPVNWNFHQAGWPIQDTTHYLSLHAKAVANAMFAEMPVIEGAVEAVQNLREAGVFIRIITHRLIIGTNPAQVIADTADWLAHHGIEYDDICFINDKSSVDCDLLIDDSPSNLRAYANGNRRFLIFDQPYNQNIWGPRAMNWSEAESHILARANLL